MAILLATLLVATLGVARPAEAFPAPERIGRYQAAPGLVREIYEFQTGHGRVVAQLLRFSLNDERVTLRTELADGHVPGIEPVHTTLQRLGSEAVAGVNGTFFFANPGPFGEPEGLLIRNKVYVSNPQLAGPEARSNPNRRPRGGFALFDGGRYEVGRPAYEGRLKQPDGKREPISGLNRHPARPREQNPDETEITVFNRSFGASTLTPSGTAEMVLRDVELTLNTEVTAEIASVNTSGNTAIPDDGVVVAASGQLGRRYARGLRPGQKLGIRLTTELPWDNAEQAATAGPVIVEDGRTTSRESWSTEGFGPYHVTRNHPRTLVGFTADNEMLLVTVDGRQPGYSTGASMEEAAHLMQHFGAVDAVSIDGGGSTTMAVDGRVFNRPSDDSGPRGVSNALVAYSNVDTPDVIRLGGANRYAVARRVANAGWTDGSETVVLANGTRFPDALAGGPLAAELNAPLLLTPRDRLTYSAEQALNDLEPRRVLVLGGKSAISDKVVEQLRGRGHSVSRVAGRERTETAAAVADRLGAPDGRVLLASADDWPDALSATVPAAKTDTPLLTTWTDRVSKATNAALRRLDVSEVVVVGGPAAISESVVNDLIRRGYRVRRVAGPNRFATSTEIVDWGVARSDLDTEEVALATANDFPDALIGGPWGARVNMPVVLTEPLDIDRAPEIAGWVDDQQLAEGWLLGGRPTLASWLAHQLQGAISE